MSALLLNGASSPADPACAPCTEVERQLAAQFDTVRVFHLAGYDIGHCMGEFDCFVKTPGRCRIHDEGQEIERAVHDAELVVLVTPLHYGGNAAQLKKAVDRLLPLISPFFRKAGDTLLEAALNAGIALPFSCCSGGCGACRVHITDHLDHVVLDEPNTVTPEARSRGEVPACLVRLTGPCRFRLP